MKHNTGVSNIEITDQNIRAFSATAKKYGIDFALKKDTSGEIPRYLVFFQGPGCRTLSQRPSGSLRKEPGKREKASIRKELEQAKQHPKSSTASGKGQDQRPGCGIMTVDLKKILILNLPYLLFVYLFDKLCQAVRLAPGLDASEKVPAFEPGLYGGVFFWAAQSASAGPAVPCAIEQCCCHNRIRATYAYRSSSPPVNNR